MNTKDTIQKDTEAGHTPGPWTCTAGQGINELGCYYLWDADGNHCEANNAEAIANARLIAASPSLYDFVAKQARFGLKEAKEMLDSLSLSY